MRTPLERQAVPPKRWGALTDYTQKWADDGKWKPEMHILHYGGGPNPGGQAPYSQESEMAVLRSWDRFHVRTRNWRAIAYNRAVGQTGTLYVARGDHRNGGQYPPWNDISLATVFILGGDQTPTLEARRTFGRLWLEQPYTGKVLPHRACGQTFCPGDWISLWIDREGWIDDLGVWSFGDQDPVVTSIKARLHRLGYRLAPGYGPRFNRALRRQITRFQKRQGIRVDGVVGPQTLRALGGLLGEVYPDVHDDPTG